MTPDKKENSKRANLKVRSIKLYSYYCTISNNHELDMSNSPTTTIITRHAYKLYIVMEQLWQGKVWIGG